MSNKAHNALVWLACLGVAAAGRKKQVPAPPPPSDFTTQIVVSVLVVATVGLIWWMTQHTAPKATCSLVFCSTDENMTAVWHMSDRAATTRDDECVLARFVPTVPVSSHKLTHNCGRNELVRAVSQNKVFHFGWVQFLQLALKHGRATVSFQDDVPKRAVLLAAVNTDSRVLRCRKGATLNLTTSVAVASVPSMSKDFDMGFFDCVQFELLGNRLGAADSFEVGAKNSPVTKSKLARGSSRSDMPMVQKTMSTKQSMD